MLYGLNGGNTNQQVTTGLYLGITLKQHLKMTSYTAIIHRTHLLPKAHLQKGELCKIEIKSIGLNSQQYQQLGTILISTRGRYRTLPRKMERQCRFTLKISV